jgi:hypothetical protein
MAGSGPNTTQWRLGLGCPTFLNPPWQVPGWAPATIGPGVTQINLNGSGVPNGATVAYLQLSVLGTAGQAAGPTDSTGALESNVSRAQVVGTDNDTLGFAPIFTGNNIYIRNYSGANLSVWVRVVGYN